MRHRGFDLLVKKRKGGTWVCWTKQEPILTSWGFDSNEALERTKNAIDDHIHLRELMKQKSNKKKKKKSTKDIAGAVILILGATVAIVFSNAARWILLALVIVGLLSWWKQR